MKKHLVIKASSCVDMINAFNSKIAEFDPEYVGGAEKIQCESEVCPECGNPAEECVCGASDVCPECGNPSEECVCGACDGDNCQETIESADEFDDAMEIDSDQEYIQGDEGFVDEAYVDDMMQYVADEVTDPEFNATCSWRVEDNNLVFVLTGFEGESVEEYTCPLSDLTGDINADIDYIMESIRGE